MASLSTDTDAGPPTEEEIPQAGGRASGDKTPEHVDQMEDGRRSASPAAAASQPRRPSATVRGECLAAVFGAIIFLFGNLQSLFHSF